MILTSSNYRTFKYKKRWGKREQQFKHTKGVKKVKFHENPRPHIMYHADTREVTLGNGSLIYQISVEDDYSRGYMALCVFPKKHPYFVILTLLRAFRLHRKPKLFHHDNGGEYNNGVVSIERVERAIPEYLRFRNESKGQWARYGKTASSVLKMV
nr:hypothetical protein BSM_24840 [uncultured archaeon]